MDFNYSELLGFDRAASVTLTEDLATRKLAAWDDRLTISDYPAVWQVDLLNGDFVDLKIVHVGADELVWSGEDYELAPHSLAIAFEDGAPIAFGYSGKKGSVTLDSVTEGLITLDNESMVSICDPDIRNGGSELKITYTDIERSGVSVELDDYCHANLNVISDTEVKGHKVIGTWRLAEIRKLDSDSPDYTKVVLVYKRGYATTLDFSEAIIMNMVDYKENNSTLVIKFPNIDPRYVQSAKATYSGTDTLTNPVFGGVRYDGYWTNIKMETSEVSSRYADLEDAITVIWFLSRHNNTNLYFKYYNAETASIMGHYFKWEATAETLDELFSTIQFDDEGNIVESGGSTLNQPVYGRSARMQRTVRGEDDRLFDIEMQISWRVAVAEMMLRIVNGDGTVDVHYATYGTEAEVEANVAALKFDATGNIDSGGVGLDTAVIGRSSTIRKVFRRNEAAIFDVDVVIRWAGTVSRSITITTAVNETRVIDKGEGVSEVDFSALVAAYAVTPPDGVERSFDYKLIEGRYDYVGITVTTTSKIYDGGDDGNGGKYPIMEFGEPLEVTAFVAKYVGNTLPQGESVVGEYIDIETGEINPLDGEPITVKLEGRRKSVTRLKNPLVTNGLFNYDLFETTLTAPINGGADAWFVRGDRRIWEREIQKIQTQTAEAQGSIPFEIGEGVPRVGIIAIYRRRRINTTVETKYFMREPTSADLLAAGINPVELDAPSGVSGDDISKGHTDISYETKPLSRMYGVFKTTIVYGNWEHDHENVINIEDHINYGEDTINPPQPVYP